MKLAAISLIGISLFSQVFRPVGRLECMVTIKGTSVEWTGGSKFTEATDGHWSSQHIVAMQYAGRDWAVASMDSDTHITLKSSAASQSLDQATPSPVVILTFDKRPDRVAGGTGANK